jgi:hypothetical protein
MTMPNFIVIGAPRAGTTALWHMLRQHPQIYMSELKEPRFFAYEGGWSEHGDDGRLVGAAETVTKLPDYEALFDRVHDEHAIGEASPVYLYSQRAPQRIAHYVPDARLVAVLRQPAERAYSHFVYNRARSWESLDNFAAALACEDERVEHGSSPVLHYRRQGFYHSQLQRYGEWVRAGRIRVFLQEELLAHPQQVMEEIARFLDLENVIIPGSSDLHNVSGSARGAVGQNLVSSSRRFERLRSRVPPGVKRRLWSLVRRPSRDDRDLILRLTKGYRDDIARLEALLDRDLTDWLHPKGSASGTS